MDLSSQLGAKLFEYRDIAPGRLAIDTAGNVIRFINNDGAKIFGYQPEELIGKPLSILLPTAMSSAGGEEGLSKAIEISRLPENLEKMREFRERTGVRKDQTEVKVFVSHASINIESESFFCAFFAENKKKVEIADWQAEVIEQSAFLDSRLQAADGFIRLIANNPSRTKTFLKLMTISFPVLLLGSAVYIIVHFALTDPEYYIDKYLLKEPNPTTKEERSRRIQNQAPQ